jgi:hypothetical protein
VTNCHMGSDGVRCKPTAGHLLVFCRPRHYLYITSSTRHRNAGIDLHGDPYFNQVRGWLSLRVLCDCWAGWYSCGVSCVPCSLHNCVATSITRAHPAT